MPREVLLKNLHARTLNEDIMMMFGLCGKVESLQINRNHEKVDPKTEVTHTAVIRYADRSSVHLALLMQNALILGKGVQVEEIKDTNAQGEVVSPVPTLNLKTTPPIIDTTSPTFKTTSPPPPSSISPRSTSSTLSSFFARASPSILATLTHATSSATPPIPNPHHTTAPPPSLSTTSAARPHSTSNPPPPLAASISPQKGRTTPPPLSAISPRATTSAPSLKSFFRPAAAVDHTTNTTTKPETTSTTTATASDKPAPVVGGGDKSAPVAGDKSTLVSGSGDKSAHVGGGGGDKSAHVVSGSDKPTVVPVVKPEPIKAAEPIVITPSPVTPVGSNPVVSSDFEKKPVPQQQKPKSLLDSVTKDESYNPLSPSLPSSLAAPLVPTSSSSSSASSSTPAPTSLSLSPSHSRAFTAPILPAVATASSTTTPTASPPLFSADDFDKMMAELDAHKKSTTPVPTNEPSKFDEDKDEDFTLIPAPAPHPLKTSLSAPSTPVFSSNPFNSNSTSSSSLSTSPESSSTINTTAPSAVPITTTRSYGPSPSIFSTSPTSSSSSYSSHNVHTKDTPTTSSVNHLSDEKKSSTFSSLIGGLLKSELMSDPAVVASGTTPTPTTTTTTINGNNTQAAPRSYGFSQLFNNDAKKPDNAPSTLSQLSALISDKDTLGKGRSILRAAREAAKTRAATLKHDINAKMLDDQQQQHL